jgi:formyl-CoA transferase
MTRPLEGILVVALEQVVAAPMCGRRLADAGARVIKIERPEGDNARTIDKLVHGESTHFVWLNRGKESVVLDLARPDDRSLFEAMLAKADVFVQNLKPGAIAKLGYATEDLCARYPRLVCCSISGYGETGPFADRKAYDLLIQAEAGLASITGGPEAPARVGVSLVDIGTGQFAYEAILEALLARARTGKGADLKVSMFDAMMEWMTVPLLLGEWAKAPTRIGLKHPTIAPYGVYTAKDGLPILISVQNDREWRVFADKILGDAALGTDERFASNPKRLANRTTVDGIVQTRFAKDTAADLAALMKRHDVAFGSVNDVAALLKHPVLRRVSVETPTGPVAIPAPPVQGETIAREFGPVPALGAHTEAVRREFLGR